MEQRAATRWALSSSSEQAANSQSMDSDQLDLDPLLAMHETIRENGEGRSRLKVEWSEIHG